MGTWLFNGTARLLRKQITPYVKAEKLTCPGVYRITLHAIKLGGEVGGRALRLDRMMSGPRDGLVIIKRRICSFQESNHYHTNRGQPLHGLSYPHQLNYVRNK
jgi:hypothetical protein